MSGSQGFTEMSVVLLYQLAMSFLLVLHGTIGVEAVPMVYSTEDSKDPMGHYLVHNSLQCQRLCWYRKLCTAYNYNARPVADVNCVLYAHAVKGTTVLDGLTLQKAANQGIQTSCAKRPCGNRDMCMPKTTSSEDVHFCQSLPANCGKPGKVSGGSFKFNGTLQDDQAILTCDDGGSITLTCTVTAKWHPPNVFCEMDSCHPNPCLNQGVCTLSANSWLCDCNGTGFKGDKCEVSWSFVCAVKDNCQPDPCQNGGICDAASGTCNCTGTGFIGTTCQERNPCEPDPCENGGVCNSTNGSCDCSGTGFMGLNCQDVDLCYSNVCLNGGVCNLSDGSCNCTGTGFMGITCQVKGNCQPDPCQNGGICDPASGTCNCSGSGFMGITCQEENPCEPDPCENGGVCNSTNGSCDCTGTGFVGLNCQDVDLCYSNVCLNGGVCNISDGSCNCTGTGFMGITCQVKDKCQKVSCQNGGVCDPASGTCNCTGTGFMGTNCKEDNPCEPDPCENGGVCNSTNGSCDCAGTGFMGLNCQEENPCEPDPCENGGVCNSTNGSCDCTGTGFMGLNCQDVNPCDPDPCQNGGICQLTDGSCNCTETGFKGETCEEKICPNTSHPLQNVDTIQWRNQTSLTLEGTILGCVQDFIPSSDDARVFCDNDQWSGATCNRRIFHNPLNRQTQTIPRPVAVGWTGCIQGILTADKSMVFYLMETPDNSWAYLQFQTNVSGMFNGTVFSTYMDRTAGYMPSTDTYNINPFPFVAGHNFSLNFRVMSQTQLQIEASGVANRNFSFIYDRSLFDITGVYYAEDATVTYMDLWCEEIISGGSD